MQEGQLLMTQADRDRLVVLKKAQQRLITQPQAAEELEMSVRQVQRLLAALKTGGDRSVVHGLWGKPSNRKIDEAVRVEAVQIGGAGDECPAGAAIARGVEDGWGPKRGAWAMGQAVEPEDRRSRAG